MRTQLRFGAIVAVALSAVAEATPAFSDADLITEVSRMASVGSCGSPSFSPDGRRIAFVSDLNGTPQLWTIPTEGGFPRQVTDLEDQISDVKWSPTGDWLAFSLAPGGGMNRQVYRIQSSGAALHLLTDGGQDNNWLGDWSHDGQRLSIGSSRRDASSIDAWVWDKETDRLELIAENPGIGFPPSFSRDGKYALILRVQSRSSNDLVLRALDSGTERLLTPHDRPGEFGRGVFSPDGKTVYLSPNRDQDRKAFARVRLGKDGEPGPIEVIAARKDAELDGYVLSNDGRTALLAWNTGGRSEIEIMDVERGQRRAGPQLPVEVLSGMTISRDDRYVALTLSGSTSPTNIWVWDRTDDRLWQLTDSPHAGVDLSSLVRAELVTYEAHDGLALSGWLYRPAGVDGRAPYVLSFHGGPEAQERPRFMSTYQALLSRGIGVFAPNVRGSAGFGKRFVNLDNGALRFDAIRDIKASVDFLVDSGIGDPDRLGIAGGSYGGYMTMAGLAWYPKLFAAGANSFGMVNFETFFAQTQPWLAAISTIEYGDPETQVELLRDLSPIHKVDQVRAATIVLHGANDTNVPVVEAEQVVDSLKRRGIPVQYVLFQDEGHGFRKTANRIAADVAIVEWFEQYLE